jgi:hypothetical protein
MLQIALKYTRMKYILTITFVLFFQVITHAQPIAPNLEFVCELKVELEEPMVVGNTPSGLRRIIPIIGGAVDGPLVKGIILKGGADWQFIRDDGVTELEAHYQFKTDDGVIIYIKNVGLRVATPEVAARIAKGEPVSKDDYYFRTTPIFEAPEGKYYWMNNALFICTGERNPDNVLIHVWKVL